MNFRKKLGFARAFLFMVIILTCSATLVAAEDGWNSTVGIGVYRSNVYLGSNDYYLTPIPMAQTSYTKGDVSVSLSLLDGLGVMYSNKQSGFSSGFTLTYGEERDSEEYSVIGISMDHSDNTKKLLKDSPTVSTPVSAKAMFGYLTQIGTFGASIEYHPSTVEYGRHGQEDADYKGFLYSLDYSIDHPVTEKLIITAKIGVEFMNQDYANAWYTVKYQTDQLSTFEATAGLRDVVSSLQVTRMFSERTGVSLFGEGTILLMDAKKSPYTVESFQTNLMLLTFYNF